jgi:adenylosuccinate lyase
VHVPLTSYDALDTARALQFSRAHQNVIRPLTVELISRIAEKAKLYEDMVQIGRTHGQHALPITVGFWLATILSRIITNAQEANRFALCLRGKISGAVGAYNAQVGLGITKLCGEKSFEERVLKKLDLEPGLISTQILPPEPLAYYLFSLTMLSQSLGQLGRDCRNLMRTEIGEVCEPWSSGQVGSSTMAHKRNPLFFENTEGTGIKNISELLNVLLTLTSEHQRDLVGSSVARDFPTIVVNLTNQLNTLLRKNEAGKSFIERISIDEDACQRNFQTHSGLIMAEPVYLALQMAGYGDDAHELVNRKAMPIAQKENMSIFEAVEKIAMTDRSVEEAVGRIPPEVRRLLTKPSDYIGLAKDKTRAVCDAAVEYRICASPAE